MFINFLKTLVISVGWMAIPAINRIGGNFEGIFFADWSSL